MNQRVSELMAIISQAEVELAAIRADCSHPSYFVGIWSWRVGSYQPSRICNECHNSIPGITEEEIAEHNRGTQYGG
jgi:hypothetical protein